MGQLRSMGHLNSSRAFVWIALHCEMAQQPPDLLLKTSKITLATQPCSHSGTIPSLYLSLSSSSFLGSKFSCELLAACWHFDA